MALFKGQLTLTDIENMVYKDAIALKDVRVQRLQREQKDMNNSFRLPGGDSLEDEFQ